MIKLYTAMTGNGKKPAIMLSELGLSYELHVVDLRAGENRTSDYLALNPDGKIPVLVDSDGAGGRPIAESGAILLYLAQKSGRFLPHAPAQRWDAVAWLFWQASWVVQSMSQLRWLNAQEDAASFDFFSAEVVRQLEVIEARLNEAEYLAGEYSVADMAVFPYLTAPNLGLAKMTLEGFPAIQRWAAVVGERPAVKKGMALEQ